MSELGLNQAAFAIDDKGDVELFLPEMKPDDTFPRPYLLIIALAAKSRDALWIDEMIEYAELLNEQRVHKHSRTVRGN